MLVDPERQCGGTLTNRDARALGSGRAVIVSDAAAETMLANPAFLAHVTREDREGRLIIQRGHASKPDCDFIFGVFPGTNPRHPGQPEQSDTTPPIAINVTELHKVGIINDADYQTMMSNRWTETQRVTVRVQGARSLMESKVIHLLDSLRRPPVEVSQAVDAVTDPEQWKKWIRDAADKVLPDAGTISGALLVIGALLFVVVLVKR